MIVSIASTTRDAGSSAMSPGQTTELLRVFRKQANNIMMDFNRRANIVPCCLRFLFLVRRLQEFHEDIVSRQELDVRDFL